MEKETEKQKQAGRVLKYCARLAAHILKKGSEILVTDLETSVGG